MYDLKLIGKVLFDSVNLLLQEQYFNWNSQERGLVLSSFYWGYILYSDIWRIFSEKI